MTPLFFSTFEVTTQAFYRASLSYAIVNLKPIVPGRKHLNIIDPRILTSLTRCARYSQQTCSATDGSRWYCLVFVNWVIVLLIFFR